MLYSDMKEGIVSKEDYVELHAAYGKRLRNAEESIRAIQKEMDSELEKADNANTWLDYFVKYQDIEELSRTVVVELIRQIRVYDKKNIEITFDFDDCYQTLLNQLPAMGVDTVIDDDNNLQVKVKEVVYNGTKEQEKHSGSSQQCNRPDRGEQTVPGRIVCQNINGNRRNLRKRNDRNLIATEKRGID